MNRKPWGISLGIFAVVAIAALCARPVCPAVKNMAVVTAAGNKLTEVTLADLGKLCKGTQKVWPDGRTFTLIIHDPESAETKATLTKILGPNATDVKAAIAKLNETRPVIKLVASDGDLLKTVAATPGAIGILDVYSINSTVKVLRVDGKLPFDPGYALKAN